MTDRKYLPENNRYHIRHIGDEKTVSFTNDAHLAVYLAKTLSVRAASLEVFDQIAQRPLGRDGKHVFSHGLR